MINQDKWINSIPKINNKFDEKIKQLDSNRWVNTISKKTTYGTKNSYGSVKKYSLAAILFVSGLLLVSAVKNETRNLQKAINNLEASIDVAKFNLKQAILDNEVITAPENIFRLAKEYLNTSLVSYKRSQIKQLSDENEKFTKVNKIKKEKINKKKIKNLSDNIKTQVAKRIEIKKTEMRKLQELYYNPSSIPKEIKTQVAVQIEEKKNEIRNIYSAPKDIFTLERVGRWSVIQVVKLFLGMPVIPGR
ncbi:uncharacterized protein METZ01_LOCUS296749 [marine metagenome]|uniref:Uncharacterized protein n=1 Tax=marine metagenome TaxID=408172 RepID=A0A382M7B9_9ZZZZ